jgi:hypothetical protein
MSRRGVNIMTKSNFRKTDDATSAALHVGPIDNAKKQAIGRR